MALHSINTVSRLYCISLDGRGGFSCLGFDYAEKLRAGVMAWTGEPSASVPPLGTAEHYQVYCDAMAKGAAYAQRTGKRCDIDLTPQLIGLEGCRVEVTEASGESRRFVVGKSTGWMPCHLEIARRTSHGGGAALGPYQSVRKLYNARA